jgi:uncharacterized protein YbaP (TraB family)
MIFLKAMSRGLARGLAGVLLLAFGAHTAHARGETSVWSMKGAHNTVYLAGSVHALPKGHSQFPEQLDRAYAAAEVIVLEVRQVARGCRRSGAVPAHQRTRRET